jgi:hypothetical protein
VWNRIEKDWNIRSFINAKTMEGIAVSGFQ